MRVLELHIENIRGIRSIDLKPQGKNFVIYGPNGSGKSAVVDALDFLMTGNISRLKGEGTLGITLGKHGCHIDSVPEDTIVHAVLQVPGSEEPIELKRSISSSGTLEVVKGKKSELKEILEIAGRGHHVLSRRDILKYVAAQRGERAKEIQALLNLENIERLRQEFVRVENDSRRAYESAQEKYDSAREDICHYLSLLLDQFSENEILDRINKLRAKLGGKPVSILDESQIKKDIKRPMIGSQEVQVNPDFIRTNIKEITKAINEDIPATKEKGDKLISILKTLRDDEILKKEYRNRKLLALGVSLLDESGKCPLCEKDWDPGELEKKLRERLSSANKAENLQTELGKLTNSIKPVFSGFKRYIEKIDGSLDPLNLEDQKVFFQKEIQSIDQFLEAMLQPEEKLEKIEKFFKAVDNLTLDKFSESLDSVDNKLKKEEEKISERQKAWESLIELGPSLRAYGREKKNFEKSKIVFARANLIKTNYELVKDSVLNELFDELRSDFEVFYKFIHNSDEGAFESEFKAKGAELVFEVDFYGRGKFPPVALHSEGHQDSMGVCLYLALMKLLSEDKMNLTILDDVVMSIDSAHRRAFSSLLLKYFPDRQFLITTHNRTWARQLNTDGVAQKRNMIEFQQWSVESGPVYEEDKDIWNKIFDFLDKNNVSSASHALREASEFYFNQVCEKIQSKVVHKCDGRHELGDLLPSAMKRYKELLKKAKRSAKSWEKEHDVEKLAEIESTAAEIFNRSQAEQWGINENVHYSKWGDFSSDDFRPIAEAFKDLFDLYSCSKCGGMIYVSSVGTETTNLRCNCEYVAWNLLLKDSKGNA